MKIHFDFPKIGVLCHTVRTRMTTHRQRTTTDPSKVTCVKCQKWAQGYRPSPVSENNVANEPRAMEGK